MWYYLTDGIYPEWYVLMQLFCGYQLFAQQQEANKTRFE